MRPTQLSLVLRLGAHTVEYRVDRVSKSGLHATIGLHTAINLVPVAEIMIKAQAHQEFMREVPSGRLEG